MILYDEPLIKHTTFRIGGAADILMIPESRQELLDALARFYTDNVPYKFMGNGSNILVSDMGVRGNVIKNTQSCLELDMVDSNTLRVGASVKLQKFINFAIEHDLGGMEYLYSIPATVGGAIYMNAGRGRKHNLQISNSIIEVEVYGEGKTFVLKKSEMGFSYRRSVFQSKKDWIILSGTFSLPTQPHSIGKQKIEERMQFAARTQDRAYPSAGSIFLNGSPLIFKLVRGWQHGGAQFSTKTDNWINNIEKATAHDVKVLIRHVQALNLCLFSQVRLEIEVW